MEKIFNFRTISILFILDEEKVAKFLRENNVNVNIGNGKGETLLHTATRNGIYLTFHRFNSLHSPLLIKYESFKTQFRVCKCRGNFIEKWCQN